MRSTKILFFLFLSILLASCGNPKNQETPTMSDTINNIQGMKEATEAAKIAESGKPEDVAKSVDKFAEIGANMELQAFEKTQAIDTPTNFPTDLLYAKGKIVSASNNSSGEYIDQEIEIKTVDKVSDISDNYKKVFASNGWKITSQTNSSNGAEYSATKEDGSKTRVSIEANQYSKIVVINIDYSKYSK